MSFVTTTNTKQQLTARLKISARQVAAALDARLYADDLSDAQLQRRCLEAHQWGLAAVIVRPEQVPAAAIALRGRPTGIATALGWDDGDERSLDAAALVSGARKLAASGATELGVVATASRLSVAQSDKFEDGLGILVETASALGVRVRVIVDTGELTSAHLQDVCRAATNAYVWMVQGGSWRGQRTSLSEIEQMRRDLPGDVLLKWTAPVRRVETLLLCIAFGVDRFNADVNPLMASAIRAEWHGPLEVPKPGVDF